MRRQTTQTKYCVRVEYNISLGEANPNLSYRNTAVIGGWYIN